MNAASLALFACLQPMFSELSKGFIKGVADASMVISRQE